MSAAAQTAGTDVAAFVVAAAREKAKARFDETQFTALLDSDPEAALDYVIEHTPDHRVASGLPPLTQEQLIRAAFYED